MRTSQKIANVRHKEHLEVKAKEQREAKGWTMISILRTVVGFVVGMRGFRVFINPQTSIWSRQWGVLLEGVEQMLFGSRSENIAHLIVLVTLRGGVSSARLIRLGALRNQPKNTANNLPASINKGGSTNTNII